MALPSCTLLNELNEVGRAFGSEVTDRNVASLKYCETATQVSILDPPLSLCRTALYLLAINGVPVSTHTALCPRSLA